MITKEKLNFDPSSADSLAASDSLGAYVRAGDDGTLIGHVSDALKVNLSNSSIAVTATDLDIRDLAFATDKVDISGSSNVAVTDGGGSLTVDAVNLDIRDLAFATDKVDISGSSNVGVTATDFDIRNLDYSQDNIQIKSAAGVALAIDASGFITAKQGTSPWVVSATDLDIRDLSASQDKVQAWLRDGAGTAITSTLDGAKQAVDVHLAGSDVEINVDDRANTALANSASAVTTTSAALLASQQAARKFLWAQNLGNVHCYVGASGVTTATGLRMSPGTIAEFRFGPALSLHAVAQSGTQDFRIMQAS
jgi:hypothetical protein